MTASKSNIPSVSALLSETIICESCGLLRRCQGNQPEENKCPNCGAGPSHMRPYFPPAVHTMVMLMHRFYAQDLESENHMLSVVLSFCSFTELLMQNFLMNRMMQMEMPFDLQQKLLHDYPYMNQRQEKLFPILTGRKWRDALKHFDLEKSVKFLYLDNLYQELSKTKILFLHRGNKTTLSTKKTQQAMHNVTSMLMMFIELHQKYIFEARNRIWIPLQKVTAPV